VNQPLLKVNLKNLVYNYNALKSLQRHSETACVVKANAYGLGVKEVSNSLISAGCNTFFVSTLDEGIKLRKVSNKIIIYVLNGIHQKEINKFNNYKLFPVINTIREYNLVKNGYDIKNVAIHFDTGINRLGLNEKSLNDILIQQPQNRVNISIVMSHLASGDDSNNTFNRVQKERLIKYKNKFQGAKLSLSNSAGIFLGTGYHLDLTRPGISLYGGYFGEKSKSMLMPVIKLQATVLQIRKIYKGDCVGYGQTFIARNIMYVGVINLGYADGIKRILSNNGVAFLKNKRLKFIGRVSMNSLALDVTPVIKEIKEGDSVKLINDTYDIESFAKRSKTISNEILTSFGERIQRIYIK